MQDTARRGLCREFSWCQFHGRFIVKERRDNKSEERRVEGWVSWLLCLRRHFWWTSEVYKLLSGSEYFSMFIWSRFCPINGHEREELLLTVRSSLLSIRHQPWRRCHMNAEVNGGGGARCSSRACASTQQTNRARRVDSQQCPRCASISCPDKKCPGRLSRDRAAAIGASTRHHIVGTYPCTFRSHCR